MEPIEFSQITSFSKEVEEDLELCIAHRQGGKLAVQEDDTGIITTRTGSILGRLGIELATYAGKKGFTGESAEKKLQVEILEKLRALSNPRTSIDREKIQKYEELIKKISDLSTQYLSSAKEDEQVASYVKMMKEHLGHAQTKIKEFHEARQNFDNIFGQISNSETPLRERIEKCKYLLNHSKHGGTELYKECRQRIRDVIGGIIVGTKAQIGEINKGIVAHLRVPRHLINDLFFLDELVKDLSQVVADVDDSVLDHRDEMNELRLQHTSLKEQINNVGSIAMKFAEAARKKIEEQLHDKRRELEVLGKKEEGLLKEIEGFNKKGEGVKQKIPNLLEAVVKDLQLSHPISKVPPLDYWSGEIDAIERQIQASIFKKNKEKTSLATSMTILRFEEAKKIIQQLKELRRQYLDFESTRLMGEGQLKDLEREKRTLFKKIDQLQEDQIRIVVNIKASGPAAELINRSALLIFESRKILGIEESRKLAAEITSSIPALPEGKIDWEMIEDTPPKVIFPNGEEEFRKTMEEILKDETS